MKRCIRYVFALIFCSLLIMPVYAKDIAGCSSKLNNLIIDEKIANTVHTIIFVIQIVVPVILVIFGMIDLIKSVIAGKEDEIKKNQMTFVKRLIAAVIVFFVFVIVKLVVSLASGDEDILNCMDCFINGTDDKSCKLK